MTVEIADRVQETTTTTGTGTVTLAGAVTGYQTFASAFDDGDLVWYCIEDGTDWEVGRGTYSAGTLARTLVKDSSNAGLLVGFGAGDKNVFVTHPADSITEPESGFVDRTDNTLTFNEGTRTLTLTPVGTEFVFYSDGIRFEKTAADNFVIADTEGAHYIYYDETGTLTEITSFNLDIIIKYAFVSLVYWDFDNKEAVLFSEERHGRVMDSSTHSYLHNTEGARYAGGMQPADIITDASGDLDTHAQISVGAGVLYDEDIRIALAAQTAPASLPFLYHEGASKNWRKIAGNGFVVPDNGANRARYNNVDAGGTGVWGLTEVTNNDFICMHLFAANDLRFPYFWVIGQAEYTNLGDARAGAAVELASLDLDGLPTAEEKAVATFIIQTGNGYSNTVASRIRSTDTGADFIDWRTVGTNVAFEVTGGTTQNAAQVPFTPAGNIAATDVQAAIEELDTEKLAQSDIETAGAGGDPDFANVALLLPFDGADGATTTADLSPTPKTVTLQSTAQLDDAQTKYGATSLLLNGTTDYATAGVASDWKFLNDGSQDWTLEFWVRPSSVVGVQALLSTSEPSASNGFTLAMNGADAYITMSRNVQGQLAYLFQPTGVFTANVWQHIALVHDSTANTLTLYKDGVSQGSSARLNAQVNSDPDFTLHIGRRGNASDWFFGGHIDDVRVTENGKRYTVGFTAPTEAHPTSAGAPTTRLLPLGGTTGQVLAKATDADVDVEWIDAASGGGLTEGKAIALANLIG